MVKVSDEPIGYAEEAERFIVHFSKDGKPVLFEILDAKNFIVESFNVLFKAMQSEGVVVVADGENKSGAPEGDVCADRLSEVLPVHSAGAWPKGLSLKRESAEE